MAYYLKFYLQVGDDQLSSLTVEQKLPLPTDTEPGAWVTLRRVQGAETSGLNLSQLKDAMGTMLTVAFVAEAEGVYNPQREQLMSGRVRLVRQLHAWTDRAARELAIACAERTLPFWQAMLPLDDRPFQAIQVARRVVDGKLDEHELYAAHDMAHRAGLAAEQIGLPVVAKAAYAAASTCSSPACLGAKVAGYNAREIAWQVNREASERAELAWQTETLYILLGMPAEVKL